MGRLEAWADATTGLLDTAPALEEGSGDDAPDVLGTAATGDGDKELLGLNGGTGWLEGEENEGDRARPLPAASPGHCGQIPSP